MTKILNLGSLNIDDIYQVDHFVRPGETINTLEVAHVPGGKGLNQSIALAQAGAEVYHAGKINGKDKILIEAMKAVGVHTDYLDPTGEETGRAIIQVDAKGQNCILLAAGANYQIDEAYINQCLNYFTAGDFLVLQNEINNIPYIMKAAQRKGMKIVFNPSPLTPELLNYPLEVVDYFLLNEIEGEALTGESNKDQMVMMMQQKYPNAMTVLTLGKQGVICIAEGQKYSHGIYQVPVIDTTAAGDTFTGFFIGSLIKNNSIPEALRIASIASSLAVTKKGAALAIPSLTAVLTSKLKLEETEKKQSAKE